MKNFCINPVQGHTEINLFEEESEYSALLYQDFAHRKLDIRDRKVIQVISQNTRGFTIPSDYLIWMLTETQADFCRVAIRKSTFDTLGYVLALCSADYERLFIWQLAACSNQGADSLTVMTLLLSAIRKKAIVNNFSRFCFSCDQRRVKRLTRLFKNAGCLDNFRQEDSEFIQSDTPEKMFSVALQ